MCDFAYLHFGGVSEACAGLKFLLIYTFLLGNWHCCYFPSNKGMVMPRNLIGYGRLPPQVVWPSEAKVAVNFVLNYEEGAESNISDGDLCSESYLTDLPGSVALEGERNYSVESIFEYGSRVGVWRLLQLFADYQLPITIFAVGLALERNPSLVALLKASRHEVAGHGYRWISYRKMPVEAEKESIQKTLQIIKQAIGRPAKGWYTGRKSAHTRSLLSQAGLLYDSDSYADDLPYWEAISGKAHLVVPYNLDANDLRYAVSPGWRSGEDFFTYLKDTFDCLYREGMLSPKMMTIGLHPRLSGRPGRCEALRRFVEYILSFQQVWICRREEIAQHWQKNYPLHRGI